MELVITSLFQQFVNDGKIKFSRLRFHLLPVDRPFHGVGMHVFEQGPYLRQRRRPGAGIVDLSAENQVRAPIHQQSIAPVSLDELWHFRTYAPGKTPAKD